MTIIIIYSYRFPEKFLIQAKYIGVVCPCILKSIVIKQMPLENPTANISFNEFCLIKFYLGFQELFCKQASILGLNNSHLYCLVFLILLLRPEDRGSTFHTGAALPHGSAPSQPPPPDHIKPPPPPSTVSSRHVCHSSPLFLCFFLVIFHH